MKWWYFGNLQLKMHISGDLVVVHLPVTICLPAKFTFPPMYSRASGYLQELGYLTGVTLGVA
ncbi:MAG: hypothetical protein VX331_02960 [Candidatus Thermoplasmatota archaeon]|nr:hypothetical protein [Candidatus Thermoplasmatota archaeon]